MHYELKKLVIKPTFACTAKCPTCAGRRELHQQEKKSKSVSFERWIEIFDEVAPLGVETLDISGGEPTIYKRLPNLVHYAKSHGWKININTNGSLIKEEMAISLLEAGVNSITVSLYSPRPEIHDEMRKSKGLWKKATTSIRLLSEMESRYPNFNVKTQALICRENFHDFAELVKLHWECGSNRIALAYLEGDFERKFLLTKDEIEYFCEFIVPKAIKNCKLLEEKTRQAAVRNISRLYSKELLTLNEWELGIYTPKRINYKCSRPQWFALILANGDVHPCNIVEYTHYPVMGNVLENSLTEIWESEGWNSFRKNLFDMCERCPMPIYTSIPLRPPKYNTIPFRVRARSKVKKILNRLNFAT